MTNGAQVIVVSGGDGNPSLSVIKPDGFECDVELGDVPQDYGEEGRIGSLMDSWDENLIVCGGYSGTGPPFSSFKDCQNFNLKNRVWSKDPDMADWTAFAGVAANPNRQELFSVGGYHPRNTGPWPTEHIYSDAIASMNYKTRNWTVLETRLPRNTSHLCAAIGTDENQLYIVGEVDAKLDLTTGELKNLPKSPGQNHGCVVTSYKGHESLVIIGGSTSYLDLEREDATWEPFPIPPTPRGDRPTLHVIDGQLFAVGGNVESFDVDIFDAKVDDWKVVKNALKSPRIDHAATLVDAMFFPECF